MKTTYLFGVANIQGWTEVCHSVGERITLPHLATTVWWHIIALCVTHLSYQTRVTNVSPQNKSDRFVTLFLYLFKLLMT